MHSELVTESDSVETIAILPEYTLTEWDNVSLTQYRIIRRNGELTQFDANKIAAAMTKAFLAVEGQAVTTSNRIHNTVRNLTQQVIKGIRRRLLESGTVHIEEIQDQVELALMRAGEHKVARAYVIYREEHAHQRAIKKEKTVIHITDKQGQRYPLDEEHLRTVVTEACANLADVHAEIILEESLRNLFDGIAEIDVNRALVMSARSLIEKEPNYTYVAARLLLDQLRGEAFRCVQLCPIPVTLTQIVDSYQEYFKAYLNYGIQYELLDPKLGEFNLEQLSQALVAERDWQFTYLGIQTLYDRYLLHWQETRFELPQAFFMRVAMGLAVNETEREMRAIEFYNLLSRFDFMTSTPTLFNSGTVRPQLSSCFVSTIPDSAEGIMGAITDNALLSKHAGGIGNDWTPVRGMGAHIKGTNGKSGGVVPFMKIANDGLVAFNQCFSPDTLIITSQGMIKIRDIKIGDLVLSKNGKFNKVLDVFSYTDPKPMRSIEVKHSLNPLVVSDNHPFFAIKASKYDTPPRVLERLISSKISPEWILAKHLEKNDYVSQVIPNISIEVPGFTPADARLYGIMLGDGHGYKSEQEWGTKFEWGVSGSSKKMPMLNFVRSYLENHGIHYWTAERGNYIQIKWAYSKKVIRDGTTGKFLCRDQPVMPFDYADLYNQNREKHISHRLANLPLSISIYIIAGLIETDGNIHDGKEITLSNTSLPLINDLRYQCLRLGIPTAGYVKPRANNSHYGQRSDGTVVYFDHTKFKPAYVLRIPAISKLAELVSCKPLTKYNWFIVDNLLFTRIKSCEDIPSIPMVYDLKVDVDPTYMTDSALVHNSGKRRGSGCAYLETWHIDIEEFLELRKNTGDERRRTHDMNTANWIPDLFLERVHENQPWTLFSPEEVPQLHDLYGTAFKDTYEKYEAAARQGQIKIWKQVNAIELWRKMLTMLYETGHPWICFKEPCNLRNPQQHVGVVHSSNLCTEICLNTSFQEIAVCNLASINLAAHIHEGKLDIDKLQQTIQIGMRMLDNVIDINYYSVPQAKTANLRHRPVGLGIMGFQDALYQLRIPYANEAAVEFADYVQEVISYYAILNSTQLAQERGCYSTFAGSLWSQGILPIDSINLLAKERGQYLDMSTTTTLDWDSLREWVKTVGMRNSNCMAIAPTACVTGETLILSSKGLIPIASLAKSQAQWQDMQLNIVQEGNLARSDRLYLNGMKDTLRITTNRGSSIIATPNHRIRVINEQGDYVWKYFADLQIGDEVVRRLGGHEELLANKPYVSLTIPEHHHFNQKSVQLPRELDESTAFILGLYMGDGYLKYSQREHYLKKEGLGIAIHQDENALVDDLYKKLNCWGLNCLVDASKTDSGCLTHLAFSTQLVEWFEINGFSKQRGNFGEGSASAFIPPKILESNSKVLCAFLSGLFVADGTVADRHVELATVSQQLAEQVKVCLESLNILATLSISGSGSKGSRLVYRVRSNNVYACQQFLQLIGFGASLKQQRLQENLQDSHSESDMQRGHQVCSPALIVDFIQAARHAKVDKKWLNPIACSKTNGALNIYLARQVIQYYPELQQSKLGQLLVKGNLYFELIEQIEASQNVTYDLQVPKGHTYVANGFVSHNTISNICGVTQSIEPTYQNLFVKSNLSGEFTIINPYLVRDLKALGLWDEVMVNDLKYCDGSVREIERIPPELQALYATVFEIDPTWLVEAASRRQKWLDQSQSLNLYMLEPSGRKLDNLYRLAWRRGLKTTYYLRSLGATRVQKSTISHYQFNQTSKIPQACALEDPECEACQ